MFINFPSSVYKDRVTNVLTVSFFISMWIIFGRYHWLNVFNWFPIRIYTFSDNDREARRGVLTFFILSFCIEVSLFFIYLSTFFYSYLFAFLYYYFLFFCTICHLFTPYINNPLQALILVKYVKSTYKQFIN